MNSEKTARYIVDWLQDYAETAGVKGFVVGVSGGVDSAVTSTLCAKTGKPVIAMSMPLYQKADQESLADAHLSWLAENHSNVTTHSLDLTAIFQSIEATFPQDIQDGLSMANARSRLRMLTLYTFASHHKMLVAGTGNKVEDFGVGFFTKYGDGGVDLSPIADLMKSEVYQLAAELGVIEGIQNAAPTDGLWEDDRTDESQLGTSYDELEWAMNFIESGKSQVDLPQDKQDVIAIYQRFHNANKHKMLPIPVCKIPEEMK